MSRVGNAIIEIPAGVEINRSERTIEIKGPKGVLSFDVNSDIKVEVEGTKMTVSRQKNDGETRSLHGLTRAILNNMVVGVTKGWVKDLEMIGVGYRAQGGAEQLTLSVGYSHPVVIKAPAGITLAVTENTKLSVSGIDRQLVGQVAANIRSVRPPEPYKGKGIRYAGEYVRRKAGKAGKGAAK